MTTSECSTTARSNKVFTRHRYLFPSEHDTDEQPEIAYQCSCWTGNIWNCDRQHRNSNRKSGIFRPIKGELGDGTFMTTTHNRKHRRRRSVNFGGRGARHYPENICVNFFLKFPNFTWFLPENILPEFGGGKCPSALPCPRLLYGLSGNGLLG